MKIELGAIVTNVRGSIGDQTASKNRFGNFMRARVVPFEAGSSYKTMMRGYFSQVSQNWKTLTQSQRDQWNRNSLLFSFQDCFSNLRHLSGFNLFMSCNMMRVLTARTIITAPPIPRTIPAISITAAIADNSLSYIAITLSSVLSTGGVLMIYASPAVSAGISNYHGTYYYLGAIDTYVALTQNISVRYINRFGSMPAAGLKIFFKVSVMYRFNGLVSLPQFYSTIVIP